jgi:hypothetical protein
VKKSLAGDASLVVECLVLEIQLVQVHLLAWIMLL